MRYFVSDHTASQQCLENIPKHISTVENVKDADAILVFGGDGAMLHTIHSLRSLNKPFIGINKGTRGYLMNNADTIWDELDNIEFHSLWLLEGELQAEAETKTVWGFNDIWVERTGGQTMRMRISIDGIPQADTIVGDGILFCTPQGSTGYNLALRGKAISPGVPVLQVTPMSTMLNKSPLGSVILSDESVVSVDFEQIHKRPGSVYFDGHLVNIEQLKRITVRKSDRFVRLGFIDKFSFQRKVLAWQFQK